MIRASAFKAIAAVAMSMALMGPAIAQQDSGWLWGGGTTQGGSGREVVRFPGGSPGQIVVSFGDRRLYLVTKPGEALSYPIAIPREQSRWQGMTSVTQKRENPGWTPTPTMIAENPRLPRWVPGGHPMNPLGIRALYLGSSTYRIHGTDAPWTIGSAVSKGCIRMYNQDVVDLYPRVSVGAKVNVTWQTFRAGGGYASAPPPAAAPGPAVETPAPRSRGRRVASAESYAPAPSGAGASSVAADAGVASIDDEKPRRQYSAAKKVVAKRATPKVAEQAD